MSKDNGRIEVRIGPPTPTGRWLITCPHCPPAEHGAVAPNSVNGYGTQYGAMTRAIRHARHHGPKTAMYGGDFVAQTLGREPGTHGPHPRGKRKR